MKALISPKEIVDVFYVLDWQVVGEESVPILESIEGAARIAQVEQDQNIFEVALPLFWVDCPPDCITDRWFYKDGVCSPFPENPSQDINQLPE